MNEMIGIWIFPFTSPIIYFPIPQDVPLSHAQGSRDLGVKGLSAILIELYKNYT